MFVTCYNEKVTYIISKSRTFLDNPSVIPSTQRKNMKIYMTNCDSLTLKNVKSCIHLKATYFSTYGGSETDPGLLTTPHLNSTFPNEDRISICQDIVPLLFGLEELLCRYVLDSF